MIYNYPVGGLGNILFQIAGVASIAKDGGTELCLMGVNKIINDLDRDDRIITAHANQYRFVLDKFKQTNMIQGLPALQFPFHYTPPIFRDNHNYIGFFQSEKYFGHNREYIKEIISPNEEIKKVVDKYSDYFGHIAVHVRRGDYLRYVDYHPVQTVEYYMKGIDMMPKDKNVLIFSDDLEWCKQQFVGDRFVFVREKDYEEIFIMNKMNYHVISNSSFSWWGAWLAESNICVGPTNWFGPTKAVNFSDRDIIPERWVKI